MDKEQNILKGGMLAGQLGTYGGAIRIFPTPLTQDLTEFAKTARWPPK